MKHVLKLVLFLLVVITIGFCLGACGEDEHVHSAVKVEKIEADCITEGKIEHWSCSGCSGLFKDADCLESITAEAIIVPTKGHTPEEDDGDCTTSVKCTACNVITTEANEKHTPEEDDGDCTTYVKCSVCDVITTEANEKHTPEEDDGDCTTDIKCANCDVITTEANEKHTPEEDDGDCTTSVKCADCDFITTVANEEHAPEADDGDCTTSVKCANCDVITTEANEKHTPEEDDGDCTTFVKCVNCDVITTEANEKHTPEEDDGDCTTDIKCADCDVITDEANEYHIDSEIDGICDICSKNVDFVTVEETSTVYIFTAEGLYHYAEQWRYNAVLMNDIIMPDEMRYDLNEDGVNESNWDPIILLGTTFDGGGHSIIGVTVIHREDYSSVGFFSSIDSHSIVKDLHLVDITVSGGLRIGGIAGDCAGLISGCSVSGTITAYSNDAGGIAGYCGNEGLIIGCFNDASVHATGGSAGGICGQVFTDQGIIACYNTGTITSSTSDSSGIAGTDYKGALIGCYSVGKSNGVKPYGIVSYVDSTDGKVISCYFSIEEGREQSDYEDLLKYGGSIKLVDGETLSWATVLTEINAALDEAGATFRYELNEGDDAAACPLVLVPLS